MGFRQRMQQGKGQDCQRTERLHRRTQCSGFSEAQGTDARTCTDHAQTSSETGIRKRDGNAYPARYNERRNRKNEKGSKHRLCACNFRQVGQKSRFIIFIDDMFGKE